MAAERIIVQEGIRGYLLDGTLQELFRLDNLVLLHPNCHRLVYSRHNPLPSRVLHRAFAWREGTLISGLSGPRHSTDQAAFASAGSDRIKLSRYERAGRSWTRRDGPKALHPPASR